MPALEPATSPRDCPGAFADDTGRPPRPARHWPWADLMRRAFDIDVLACPRCGSRLRLVATLQQYTLDEYQNRFEDLKQALRERGFDVSLVAFLENEDEEWEIREIVQCMACFLKDRWKTVQPTQMYRSKGRALDLTSSDSHEEFRRLYLVVADVVTLPEFIQSEFSRGEAGKSKRFGGLRAVRTIKKPYTRPGTTFDTGRSDARCTPCAGSGLPSASVGRWQPVFGGLPPAESSLWGR